MLYNTETASSVFTDQKINTKPKNPKPKNPEVILKGGYLRPPLRLPPLSSDISFFFNILDN